MHKKGLTLNFSHELQVCVRKSRVHSLIYFDPFRSIFMSMFRTISMRHFQVKFCGYKYTFIICMKKNSKYSARTLARQINHVLGTSLKFNKMCTVMSSKEGERENLNRSKSSTSGYFKLLPISTQRIFATRPIKASQY